jgi:hypothetical protein
MAKGTRKRTEGKQRAPKAHNYKDGEEELAKRDLLEWAEGHVRRLGASLTQSPGGDPGLWQFILVNSAVRNLRRSKGSGSEARNARRNRLMKLRDSVDTCLKVLEDTKLDLERPTFADALNESMGKQRSEPSVVGLVRDALSLLSQRAAAAIENSKGKKSSSRGELVREVCKHPSRLGAWWPQEPTAEDLAALSIISGVAFETFCDTFEKREQRAREAAGGRAGFGASVSHLDGFIHYEKKSCRGVRPKASAK